MEIVGMKRIKFTPRDGTQEISGVTLYLEEERQDVEGYATDRVFVSDMKLDEYCPSIGDEIRILYNRWGKVDSVEPVKI